MTDLNSLNKERHTLEQRLREIQGLIEISEEQMIDSWELWTGLTPGIARLLKVTSVVEIEEWHHMNDSFDWEGVRISFEDKKPLSVMFCNEHHCYDVDGGEPEEIPEDVYEWQHWEEDNFRWKHNPPTSMDVWASLDQQSLSQRITSVIICYQYGWLNH